ncbi:head GIN domain-containing protein [Polaribacter sp. NJDZ03]|uniref:head GIN domain-containing protein n=1 Tax=Polaribacter sp. NJDZ03 TaxID=2855841 RepID=UPI001C4A693A|nr:head GIN domain-containing protein [Polaribacter sp. NJDZ03]
MKNSVSKIIAILFIATLFTSCNVDMINRINGNKNVITKTRKIADQFTGIKVSTGLDVYITQGSNNKVIVEADENLHDIIITEVEDGILKIYADKGIWRAEAKKVHVTIKDLTLLIATSGSDVYGKEVIDTDEISISATSGADINIKVNATSVETNSTSGSDINISGITINHASNATSGSSIDAYELESENTIAKVTSGANINIFASKKLEARATSGGDIDFKGNPKTVDKKTTSGGSISKK